MGTLLQEPRPTLAPSAAPPGIVAWLGYGGLIPFVGLAAAALTVGTLAGIDCRHALIAYGAVILSFVGALHWGFAMTQTTLPTDERTAAWLWSVVPALLGWTALLLPTRAAALLLIAGFLVHYARDRHLTPLASLPAWYLPLRLRLTAVACLCVLAGAAR